jgi:glutamyl-tRNA reductase
MTQTTDQPARESEPDSADQVIDTLHDQAARRRDEAVTQAMERLDASGEVSEREREEIEALADRIVSRLLAVPTRSLREAAARGNEAQLETALTLFGSDREQ